jgi:hypothetical protein
MSMAPAEFEADIWERVICPRGAMSRQAARRILELSISNEDRSRVASLAQRNRRGALSDDELAELDHFSRVATLLSILKVRARRVLKPGKRAS